MTSTPGLSRAGLPGWLAPVAHLADEASAEAGSPLVPEAVGSRRSAVLMLFAGDRAPGVDGTGERAELLLIQRSATLTSHPGQPAFPGGATDPGDDGPVGTALRETVEETGLDPAGVQPFGLLPAQHLQGSDFLVTPVLAWWRTPSPVRVVDPGEVRSVHRVALDELRDPLNRVTVTHPSGYRGPGFEVDGLLVWGFTAGLIARLLSRVGWERAWDPERRVAAPPVPGTTA